MFMPQKNIIERRHYQNLYRQKNLEKMREYARNYHKTYDRDYKQGKLRGKHQGKRQSKYSKETKEERTKRIRNYYNEKNRQYNFNSRQKALISLGGKCFLCGNDDLRVLQIDHINGDGNKERRFSRESMFRKIINMAPSEVKLKYQLLCANCHAIKTYYQN